MRPQSFLGIIVWVFSAFCISPSLISANRAQFALINFLVFPFSLRIFSQQVVNYSSFALIRPISTNYASVRKSISLNLRGSIHLCSFFSTMIFLFFGPFRVSFHIIYMRFLIQGGRFNFTPQTQGPYLQLGNYRLAGPPPSRLCRPLDF